MRKKPWEVEEERWFEKLVLPFKLRAALVQEDDEERKRQEELQAAIEVAKEAAARAADAEQQAAKLASTPGQKPFAMGRPLLNGYGPRIELIDPESVGRMSSKLNGIGLGDKQRKDWTAKTIEHIAARGTERVVHCRADWQSALESLRDAHVNFAPVLDLIEDELTLAGGDLPIVLPPMLLNGPPGCGKTFFAQNFADCFQTGFERVSMETAQTAAELTGTAAHWSNSAPGRLFNRLIDYDYANPVFLLDEVDKAGGDESHRADKALYALLERESARDWYDLSFTELHLDTSHVMWLLTSNDAAEIPAPLRSRMEQFDIKPLEPHEARRLVRTLYRQEIEGLPDFGLPTDLSNEHCEVLRHLSPRVVKRLVRRLVARLVRYERLSIEKADLEAVGAIGRGEGYQHVQRRAVGFLSNRPHALTSTTLRIERKLP